MGQEEPILKPQKKICLHVERTHPFFYFSPSFQDQFPNQEKILKYKVGKCKGMI